MLTVKKKKCNGIKKNYVKVQCSPVTLSITQSSRLTTVHYLVCVLPGNFYVYTSICT